MNLLLIAVLSVLNPVPAEATFFRPIRTNEPGTGVFIGSGLLGQFTLNRESNDLEELTESELTLDFRYTPSTNLVFGIRAPVVLERRLEHPLAGTQTTRGLGDVSLSAKYRFFRTVGAWSDRHAAFEVAVKLPTGSSDEPVDGRLPLQRRRRLQPGSGATDIVFDLVYQEGRRRFVYGGDLSYRLTTRDGRGYEFGDEARLTLDLEYILLPWVYRRPGHELFVLLETALAHRAPDRFGNRTFSETRRTEILLAPGLQYIATEQMLVSFSFQFPAYSRVERLGLERDFNLLAEFRYAF